MCRCAAQPVDMLHLAEDTWTLLAASQPQRAVVLRLTDLPQAQADPDLAAQVWQNLLDNAWKYSGNVADAKVSVDSYADGRGTWYRVADNGAGFDMAQAGGLFQPFQRMHTASQFPGTGVGLSLVRRIIDHHGGRSASEAPRAWARWWNSRSMRACRWPDRTPRIPGHPMLRRSTIHGTFWYRQRTFR